MTVSNSGGATATCSDTVFMQRDLCSNITDYQGVWPIPSDTGSVSGGTCSCDAGYQINGTGNSAQCVETVPDPVISIFDADPPRVQRNRSTTLSWTIDDPVSCSISGTDGFVYAISDGEGTVTGSVDTNPITQVTTFTLACTSGISVQKTVTVVPSVQEI